MPGNLPSNFIGENGQPLAGREYKAKEAQNKADRERANSELTAEEGRSPQDQGKLRALRAKIADLNQEMHDLIGD